jgi:hypothetical protein
MLIGKTLSFLLVCLVDSLGSGTANHTPYLGKYLPSQAVELISILLRSHPNGLIDLPDRRVISDVINDINWEYPNFTESFRRYCVGIDNDRSGTQLERGYALGLVLCAMDVHLGRLQFLLWGSNLKCADTSVKNLFVQSKIAGGPQTYLCKNWPWKIRDKKLYLGETLINAVATNPGPGMFEGYFCGWNDRNPDGTYARAPVIGNQGSRRQP